jgi:ketosteroid isomerase-like protein
MRIQAWMKWALLPGAFPFLWGCGPAEPPAAGNEAGTAATGSAAGVEPASATPSKSPADPALDEAEIIRLDRDYARALINKDRAFLMRFYASDWRGGNWMGFWSKSTMLKSVLNERYVVKSMVLRDLKVRVMGDVALVQGVDEEVSAVDGKDTSGKWSFTDIFARRAGAWVAVGGHTSEVKPTGE